jgi:putative tricarboxylic transport membrane protein
VTDIWVMVVFGLFGFAARRLGFDPAPLVLALVLGPPLETALRQALIISGGSAAIFVTRPIAALFLALATALVVWTAIGALRHQRPVAALFANHPGGA